MEEQGVATYNEVGRWKNPRLIFQGFEYALVKNALNVKYYKCHKAKCSGRLNQRGGICTATRSHNMCRPMPNLQSEAERVAANVSYDECSLHGEGNEDLEDTEPPPLDVIQDTSHSPRHKLNRLRVPPMDMEEDPQKYLQGSPLQNSKQNLVPRSKVNLTKNSKPPAGSQIEEPPIKKKAFEKRNFIPPLVWGIRRGLKAIDIVGSSNFRGPVKFLVRWDGTKQMDLVLAEEMNEHFPDVVIAFYEKRLGWKNSAAIPKPTPTPTTPTPTADTGTDAGDL